MIAPPSDPSARRPIPVRKSGWARGIAAGLARAGVSPNAISMASVVFAVAAAGSLVATSRFAIGSAASRALLVAATALIALRLLANLFDGMVAVEHGRASALGELFNEAPDRLSDVAILVGAGFGATGDPLLGALAAVAALLVAWARAFGASVGVGHVFAGPMAKQQRMWLVAAGALWTAAPRGWILQEPGSGRGPVAWALLLIGAAGLFTFFRRTIEIARRMRGERAPDTRP